MLQAGKSYVYGSTAEKLEYDVYNENRVLRKKKVHRTNSKAKFKLVCSILLVFCMCFAVMYRYALVTELNYSVYKLNKEYNDLRNENSYLKVQIDNQMSLDSIRQIAESRLGMQKPDKYQIAYVKVPKHDYTRVAEGYKDGRANPGDNMFAALFDKVSRLSRFIY